LFSTVTAAPPSTSAGQDNADGNRVNDEGDNPPGRKTNVGFIGKYGYLLW